MSTRSSFLVAVVAVFATASGIRAAEPAPAVPRVECRSINNTLQHCRTPWQKVVLIRQISRADCVRDKTWGMDSDTRKVWVWNGCSAQFAELAESNGIAAAPADSGTGSADDPTTDALSQGIREAATP